MGIEQGNSIRYRYPGSKFFEADQNDIFFGRSEEVLSLIHSIKAHDIFVIFADSGIGKTSLLNAGLIPEFQKEDELQKIMPVKFRFQDINTPPLQTIVKKLSGYADRDQGIASGSETSLWRLFKHCHFKDNPASNENLPLFVFDQFEEFFNHKKAEREECINEISDLANEYLPDYIKEEMSEKFRSRSPTPEELKYYTPPRVKMLFLIRADKLKLLDDLSKKIPLILRNRFHLKRLNIMQAKQAILFPACLPRNAFASPSFSFQEEAVQQICTYLKNEEEEVESFQLQILCQELEKRVIERYSIEKTAHSVQISEAELGGEAGMNGITKNYYINKINSIDDAVMREKAVELIEDRLIVEDRRISQSEFLLLKEGFSQELLDYLVNSTRLIRIDNDRYVEISHDRLLPSILSLKQKREEEKEKAKAIQQVREEEEKRQQQLQKEQDEEIKKIEIKYLKDKVKKAAWLRVLVVLLIALMAGLSWATIDLLRAKTWANIALARYYMRNQDYDRAGKVVTNNSFLNILYPSFEDTIQTLHNNINTGRVESALFESLFRQADSLITIDESLLTAAYSVLEQDGILNSSEGISQKTFAKTIDGENVILAGRFIDSLFGADRRIFKIPDTMDARIKTNLDRIAEITASLLLLNIDVAKLLLKANYKEQARTTCNNAQNLFSFAKEYKLALNNAAPPHLDSVLKCFTNEKEIFHSP